MNDADTATEYASAQPGFGGVYLEGERLIVLFTEDAPRHERFLSRILDQPEHLVVRTASRSLADVQIAGARIRDRLLGPGGITGVSAVGIAVSDGEFVVEVGLDPYDETRAEEIRDAVRPDTVVVRPQARPRPL